VSALGIPQPTALFNKTPTPPDLTIPESELDSPVSNPVGGNPCDVNELFVSVDSFLPAVYMSVQKNTRPYGYTLLRKLFLFLFSCPAFPQFHH
jgi:hypothetical protein